MLVKYNKYIKVDGRYTFGYKWVKNDSNYRQLFIGKSGKGFCVGLTYDKNEKIAFKDNSGYFQSCNEENNLPRGKDGTYKMLYASIYAVTERYPDAKIIKWQDNTMITIGCGKDSKLGTRYYDVSLSDSDTILYGRPRVLDIIGDNALLNKRAAGVSELIILKIKNINLNSEVESFETFNLKFYKNILPENVIGKVKIIYNKSKTLLDFFREADAYLDTQGLKKIIFVPLSDIFRVYNIATHVGMNWTFDIKLALGAVKKFVGIKKIKMIDQIGGTSFNTYFPDIKIFKRDKTWGGGDYICIKYKGVGCSNVVHFLEPLRSTLN